MTIGTRTAGAWASGSTTVAPDIHASPAAGDMMILFVGCKPYTATINQPTGWTRIGTQQTNGTTASGVDTGSVTWSVFYRAWQSGDAAPSVSVTSGNVSLACINGFSRTAAAWVTPTAYFGSDTTSGTGYSITAASSSGQIASGDYLLHGTVIAGNNATFGTPTITATSATIASVTESPATEGSTATGNDLEASCAHASVTAGTSSADAVCGWTLSVAQTGGSALVRLREDNTSTGSLAATESGSDTFSGAGDVIVQGGMSAAEAGPDVFAGAGDVIVQGPLAATETGADTFAASGTVSSGASGSLAATETGADTFAASGDVFVQGAAAAAEAGADTAAFAGDVLVRGALAAAESGADTLAGAGDVIVSGALAVAEAGADTFAALGDVVVAGAMAAAETGTDTFSASGAQPSTGGMAATEAGGDTFAASGIVVPPQADAIILGGADDGPAHQRLDLDDDDALLELALGLIVSGALEGLHA